MLCTPLHANCPHRFRYDGFLLRKAAQLGKALAKAFVSPTGIPHGSLNLRGGVVAGESNYTATATAGTLLLEFCTLSRLTHTHTYTSLAHMALASLLQHRSSHGLLGSHIDITNGVWGHRTSSLGTGSDSLYEYLLKSALLLGSSSPLNLMNHFTELRTAIKQHLYQRPWCVRLFPHRIIVTLCAGTETLISRRWPSASPFSMRCRHFGPASSL